MDSVFVSETMNVTLFDSGDSILISGTERQDVELAIKELVKLGATLVQKPEAFGSIWTASCQRADLTGNVEVETLGTRTLIRGRTLEAVQAKVNEFAERGCRLDGEIEHLDGYFIAACHDAPTEFTWVQRSLLQTINGYPRSAEILLSQPSPQAARRYREGEKKEDCDN